jgi:hypothetical protein
MGTTECAVECTALSWRGTALLSAATSLSYCRAELLLLLLLYAQRNNVHRERSGERPAA